MVVALAYLVTCGPAVAAVKDIGTLTEVDGANRTVVIDDHRYAFDLSAKIFDGQGREVEIDKLLLPTRVRYEYRFRANEGPAIRLIREIPQ